MSAEIERTQLADDVERARARGMTAQAQGLAAWRSRLQALESDLIELLALMAPKAYEERQRLKQTSERPGKGAGQ